jgi:antitoxin component YwqK of YwqJK toxin-antitoxin module
MYYDNTKLAWKGTFKDGKKDGEWEYYHRNGWKVKSITYKDDKQVTVREYEPDYLTSPISFDEFDFIEDRLDQALYFDFNNGV